MDVEPPFLADDMLGSSGEDMFLTSPKEAKDDRVDFWLEIII
jgi:hypothetical protein